MRMFTPQRRERTYKVAVNTGVSIREYECTDRFNYNSGYVFEYKNDKGEKDLVLVPLNYQYGEVNGALIIGKNLGNSSAAPLVRSEFLVGQSIDQDAPGEDLSLLYRTHMMASGYKTLYEKNVPWKWHVTFGDLSETFNRNP